MILRDFVTFLFKKLIIVCAELGVDQVPVISET